MQRYIYVCHPQLAKVWCTQGQARAAVIATISLAILHMVPRTMDRQYTIIDIGITSSQDHYHYYTRIFLSPDYDNNGLQSPLCFVNFSALKTFGISLDLYFFIFFW